MLYHGTYFRRGVKRTFEELTKLPIDEDFSDTLKKICASKNIFEMRGLLKNLLLYVEKHVKREKTKEEPSEDLVGTYEEMYSNWRNKVEEAAVNGDVFASFMNMSNLYYMFSDIASNVNIGSYDIMEEFNPDCLEDNVRMYDKYLKKYEEVYKDAGIRVERFCNVDEFVMAYLRTEAPKA